MKEYIMFIITLMFFAIVSCTDHDTGAVYPVVGHDRIEKISLVEKRKDLLIEMDLKTSDNTPLIYVSSSSPFKELEVGKFQKIYWVLPFNYFSDIPMVEGKLKSYLEDRGDYSENEIRRMTMVSGCLEGMLDGLEVSICSPRTLQLVDAPVVMAIDTDFFPLYAEGLKRSKLSAMKRFFDEMRFRRLRIIYLAISYGTVAGEARAIDRFIADELYEGMSDPGLFLSEDPPELWKQRDMAENMLSGGEDVRVVEYFEERLKKFEKDIPLKLIYATALALSGKDEEALVEMDKVCSKSPIYCYGLIDIGNMLWERKDRESAGKFYKKARKKISDNSYVTNRYSEYLQAVDQKGTM